MFQRLGSGSAKLMNWGEHVRKGEESAIVVFWKIDEQSRAQKTSTTKRPTGRRVGGFRYVTIASGQLGTMRASAGRARQEIEVPSFSRTDPTRVN